MKKIELNITEKQAELLIYALDARIELDEAHKTDGFWDAQMAQDLRGLNRLKEMLELNLYSTAR
jgi:hypothetical protein